MAEISVSRQLHTIQISSRRGLPPLVRSRWQRSVYRAGHRGSNSFLTLFFCKFRKLEMLHTSMVAFQNRILKVFIAQKPYIKNLTWSNVKITWQSEEWTVHWKKQNSKNLVYLYLVLFLSDVYLQRLLRVSGDPQGQRLDWIVCNENLGMLLLNSIEKHNKF